MTPIVNGLEAEFSERLDVVWLDVAQPANAELQAELGVRGHPSFVVLDTNGAAVAQFIGPQTEEVLRVAVETAVAPSNPQ